MSGNGNVRAAAAENRRKRCTIADCRNKRYGRGPLCSVHYWRRRRFGHPLMRRPALTEYRKRALKGMALHGESVDVRVALAVCWELLLAHQKPQYPIGKWRGRRWKRRRGKVHCAEDRLRHLHMDGVSAYRILVELCALWQHFRDGKKYLNQLEPNARDRILNTTMGSFVFALGFCGNSKPTAGEREKLGKLLRERLGDFLERFTYAVELRRAQYGAARGLAWAPKGSKRQRKQSTHQAT